MQNRSMSGILYPQYRAYKSSRTDVNDAMTALLAGSRLAAHTLQLTNGSEATLSQLFPAVEHIQRFNLKSDSARVLLSNADFHIASVAIPYALSTHEDFVISTLDSLEQRGRTLITNGKQVRAWNMHEIFFQTCSSSAPVDWLESFHALRELRNCITHAGGFADEKLKTAINNMGPQARAGWQRINLGHSPESLIDNSSRLVLTAESMFTAFAVTKELGRQINRVLATEFSGYEWAQIAVADFMSETSKTRNSSSWLRALRGLARTRYKDTMLDDKDLEQAARELGHWTKCEWK